MECRFTNESNSITMNDTTTLKAWEEKKEADLRSFILTVRVHIYIHIQGSPMAQW